MPVRFDTIAQRSTYNTVAEWLPQLFNQTWKLDDIPGFGVSIGSAFIVVMIRPLGDDDAVVNVTSVVVTAAEMAPSLMRYLLQRNNEIYFGRFSIDSDDDIICSHCCIGSTLDAAELQVAVGAVATMADDYDDEIVSRWGGKRAIDRIS